MATPSGSKKNTPIIAAVAVIVAGILIYLFTRGGPGPANRANAPVPAPLPQGKAASMARDPGKAVVLGKASISKLPKDNELGAGKEGWIATLPYSWKGEPDAKMTFKAAFIVNKRGGEAIPAKGTPGASTPTAPVNTGGAKGGKAGVTPPEAPTFLLTERKGIVHLLFPNTPTMPLKKGDKISVTLQAYTQNWTIPASNEISLPPLP